MIGDVLKFVVASKLSYEGVHCVIKFTALTEVCVKDPINTLMGKEGLHFVLFIIVIECN